MQSKNFEFLRPTWADLADIGAIAEQYAHPDPQSAVAKLRTFAEQIVLFIYHKHGLPKPYQPNLNDLLTATTFIQTVPRVVVSKLHTLRIQGNKGAHGESVLPQSAVMLLQEAHELGRWMHLTYAHGKKEDCPAFNPPTVGEATEVEKKLKKEKASILQLYAAQEAEMQKLLADLEAIRSKAKVAEETVAQLQAVQAQGQQVADALAFDEATTRHRLIDAALVSAGWDVGAKGANTEQVGQEVDVDYQPTATKKGKADYVLWGDNGKPVGVIESKKTAVDPEVGRTQAKCYADGLEKMHGQRPVIFYTSGHDIWMWNDAAGEPPRKLYGFYSPDSLQYLHYETCLPPVPEQRRIAAILDKADAIRRKREEGIRLTEVLLRSTFLEMFGDPATNPKGWEVRPFGELAKNEDGRRKPVKKADRAERHGEYPYYGASGIIDYVDEFLFNERTLLIAEDGANLLARSTPIAFIAEGKYWVNNHAHVVSANGKSDLDYLRFSLNLRKLNDFVTGSAQPKLNQASLNRIPIPLPPLPAQRKFADAVQKLNELKDRRQAAVNGATNLFGSLVQRAFRGEL